MKLNLKYDILKEIIITQLPGIPNIEYVEEVVAITRGGITIAHIIAKELQLPIGYYFPDNKDIIFSGSPNFIIIVEDLIAEGRTTRGLHNFMSRKLPCIKYMYVPFLVDSGFKDKTAYDYSFFNTNEWVVFPWEVEEDVVEGDRGLFRKGTDKYGK